MPTSPLTRPATCDIPAIHAAIASPSVLQLQRRTLYQFAAELLEPGSPRLPAPDVIDSPLARNHLGDALAGRTGLVGAELVPISALSQLDSAADGIGVASRPAANTLLTGALETVWAELDRQRAAAGPARLLTEADGERYASARGVLRDGVALARLLSPELVEDLLGHIALVGIVDPQRAGRLTSASPRNFPGLILLETPSSIAVAEALVHEGAHQKLFDLAITHDLLNATSDRCPPFHPPWTPTQRRWPLEQTLAACHAYCCLDRFEQHAGPSGLTRVAGGDSLLPLARTRSAILGEWLLDQGDYLGADAHVLLAGLLGKKPRKAPAVENISGARAVDYIIDTELEVRRCGSSDRVLVGRRSQPPELYWVSGEAATFLELVRHRTLDQVVGVLAQRWQVPHPDAADRLAALLSDLCTTGLATLKGGASGSP